MVNGSIIARIATKKYIVDRKTGDTSRKDRGTFFFREGGRMRYKIHSFRRYGEPKLKKPKILSGIQQAFSVDYIPGKCRCQVFIHKEDVWIKHRDYFSEVYKPTMEELGRPLNYFVEKHLCKNGPQRFIYDDAWGAVVLRNEAWIVIEGLLAEVRTNKFPLDIVRKIREQQERFHGFEKYELVSTEMERFWERLVDCFQMHKWRQ